MDSFTLNWRIDKQDSGQSIKDYLKQREISKAALTDIKFSGGKIEVNGNEENVRYMLKEGDCLSVRFPSEMPSPGMEAEDIPLAIVYEDPYVLVVNKPAAMSTIPSREHPRGSLANALIGYYRKIDLASTVHIVTRLDRDTSGLVLVAKHRHVHHLMSTLQREGRVKRTYEAFAEGKLFPVEGSIEAPIARKKDSIIEREVNFLEGQYACTHYKVKGTGEFTYAELVLETGRTHQIRVHLSHLGHPLLGDGLYGGNKNQISRQALHCRELRFFHPFLERELCFSAGLPDDMKALLE
ncbi:ribosomal large subunit pseudouridine synthase, RluD subfamily protein [Bacillus sp. NRRL B-14911]|uniref:Pseudouridine synthase n=1 Tax=Bacillus infantis NRRL B-14911 TaxID=1367477 RepID=U5L9R4_9BACI|nr:MULTISPECIES: RluA family pseudouridine synthase [Bacillus]AGX03476.1 RNA pseudouridine synthase [Bacillus infantis NRRL B-14911]EAR66401.1 ribosomal large subunit pseudouridine synthase, RluD subfamily protein [Bacillus sp. NRRL B-14911]